MEEKQTPSYEKRIAHATWVIAIATLAIIVVNILLWHTTRRAVNETARQTNILIKEHELTYRPFLGIERVEVIPKQIQGKQYLFVEFYLKNVGKIPADFENYIIRLMVDDKEVQRTPMKTRLLLFPNQIIHPTTGIFGKTGDIYKELKGKKIVLEINLTYSAQDSNKKYFYKYKIIFNHVKRLFDIIEIDGN